MAKIVSPAQSLANYQTHKFISSQDRETGEYYVYCSECGCEDQGDPTEFEWLEYPPCSEMGD